MNLIDLINRKDSRLTFAGGWRQIKTRNGTEMWRAVELENGAALTIGDVASVYRLASRPSKIGWSVRLRKIADRRFDLLSRGKCTISVREHGKQKSVVNVKFGLSSVPIPMPWTDSQKPLSSAAQLHLSFKAPKGYIIELLVHKALHRKEFVARANGNGIEIGPGPRPQIVEGDGTSVRYLEEMPIEKWAELYDPTGKYGTPQADFSKYIIGTADNLPSEDNSLDFIFSSHVFEHLANPLGHLVRWREKLTAGGVIMAVIPEMHSTKDSIGRPSTIDEIRAEFETNLWRPNESHYERYFTLRGMGHVAHEMMKKNSSIHVHFYDKRNVAALLDLAVREHGFSSYEIIHSDNHKDFYFAIWKPL